MADNSQIPPRKAGFYATLGVGAGFPGSPTTSLTGEVLEVGVVTRRVVNITQNESVGFNGEIGVGYAFGNGARTELTYGYTGQPLTSASADTGVTEPMSGTYNNNRVLVSAYYDIPTKSRFVPYCWRWCRHRL